MEIFSIIVYIVTTSAVAVWWYFRTKFSHWKKLGVPYIEPTIPYGNAKGVGKTIHMRDFFCDIYEKYKNTTPFLGIYLYSEPVAVIMDLDLVKNILIKDFSYFQLRRKPHKKHNHPLHSHMGNMEADKWHLIRTKLSPTFSSGRLKQMFPLITNVADTFVDVLGQVSKDAPHVEIKELSNKFLTDVIGSVIYGIECNCLKNPKAEFRQMTMRAFARPVIPEFVRMFAEHYPDLAAFLKIKIIPDDVTDFFLKIIHNTIKFRERNEVHRNDFMDLLIQLKNTGTLEGHSGQLGKLTEAEIAAQAFLFFTSSINTTSSTMAFALYELALNAEVQDRAREEINDVFAKYDGKLTYEGIFSMPYIHQVIDETLRKYSQTAVLFRRAVRDYPVPNSDIVIAKGTEVIIPVTGFHTDPDIFPDPDVFNPDNFTPEANAKRHSMCYLPYGEGPRNCIGMRFARILTYVGVVSVIRHFRLSPTSKTPIPVKFKANVHVMDTTTDYFLKVEKVN